MAIVTSFGPSFEAVAMNSVGHSRPCSTRVMPSAPCITTVLMVCSPFASRNVTPAVPLTATTGALSMVIPGSVPAVMALLTASLSVWLR